ncbi:MAG: NAD-dependent epimerase/dehydratase family protein, partial [Sciscionella sp.]
PSGCVLGWSSRRSQRRGWCADMRVLVIGGTRFIGRRIVDALVARGDGVLVVHRGEHEPADLARCRHLHTDRARFAGVAHAVREFAPDGVVDTMALTRADADAVLPHLPEVPLVLLSSMDTYLAYELFQAGRAGEPLPLTEDSPVRTTRYPHRGVGHGMDDYDKLLVEPDYLARGGTVLRLAMVYGEHDPQRREEFVLRRVRAGRTRIPVGAANWLWTRIHVDDVATATLAALDTPSARGEILNIGETTTGTFRGWVSQILAAADHNAELVRVPAEVLPEDMMLTGSFAQHMLFASDKARRLLSWSSRPTEETVARSVRWHLAHPPESASDEVTVDAFTADDRALAVADAG